MSGNDPTCGIIQIAGTSVRETFNAIQDIANGNFNRVQSNIELVKKYAPLLVNFILSNEIPQQKSSSEHFSNDMKFYRRKLRI